MFDNFFRRRSPRSTKADKLLQILFDGQYHSTQELVAKVGHTFGRAKYALDREGYVIITKRDPACKYGRLYKFIGQVL